MGFDLSWLLIFLGLMAVLLELLLGVSTGFDLVLIGISLILGGSAGRFLGNWPGGLLIFALLSLLYILVCRKLIKNRLTVVTHHTNVDRLLERNGLVTKNIRPGNPGLVKIDSEVWRAESEEEILENAQIKVISVEGVTLKVVKLV